MIDKELLRVLACPSCRGRVKQEEQMIICEQCGLRYPVCDDIPVMLIDEAQKNNPDE